MNILHFGKFYQGPDAGGVEAYVDTLLKGLGQSNSVVNLVANSACKMAECDTGYSHVVEVPSLGKLLSTSLCPTMPYHTWRLNKQHAFDIVHLHFPDPMSHVSSYFLPKNVKRVVTWHSDIVRQKSLVKWYQPFLKNFMRQVDAVFVTNPVEGAFPQLMECIDDPKKIHVVPIGIDVEKFLSPDVNAVEKLKIQYAKPIIFALGRHVAYKGFEYLIRAMVEVPDAVLILGGKGPLTPELKNLAQTLGIQDRVFFPGRIEERDLVNYYTAAEIFCLPSIERNEAYGIVQLEAMACGKPVVCYELNNGVTFVNQHEKTGLVVPVKDVTALARALNRLLQDNTLRSRLGEYARQRVMHEFADKTMIDHIMTIYSHILCYNAH